MFRFRAPQATSWCAAATLAIACSSGSPPPRVPGELRATAEPAPTRAPEPTAAITVPTDAATPAEPVAAAAVAPAPQLDDASRCVRLRELVEAATDLAGLRRSLTADGPYLGLSPGESFETGRELVSFCVVAEPVLSPAACLSTLGFDRPLVVRALTEKTKWSVGNSQPRPGMKLATAAPRYGPAAVLPMIADPPRGRLEPGAPKELPILSIDRDRDAIVELCFVKRQIGEDEPESPP